MIIASLCGLVERVTTSQDEVLDVRKARIYKQLVGMCNASCISCQNMDSVDLTKGRSVE